jgi:hypothetical protein
MSLDLDADAEVSDRFRIASENVQNHGRASVNLRGKQRSETD